MTARKVPSAIASGRILADVFFSVGNPCLGGFLGGFRCADYSARVWQGPLGAGWAEYPVVFPIDAPVTVTHTSVRLGRLAPGQQVELRLLARPALGYVGEVTPTNAALQVQTNGPGLGLGTDWVSWPGSETTNQVMVPLDPSPGSVFLRLMLP